MIKLVLLLALLVSFCFSRDEAVLYNPDGQLSEGVYPYLQGVTGDKAVIMWQTKLSALSSPTSVNYGLEPNNLNLTAQSEVERVHFQGEGRVWVHRVRLEGLERGKKYYYRVNLPGVAEEKRSGEFMADPGDEGAIRVLFGADVFDANSTFERLSQARGEIHLLLHAGDVGQGKLWGSWIRKAPFYIAAGNHDKGGLIEGSSFPGRDCPVDEKIYSFDYGPCHFIFLFFPYSSNKLSYPEFLNWLEQDLQNTTKPWKIMVLHSSIWDTGGLFVRGYVKEDKKRIGNWGGEHCVKYKIAPILEKYGVDLVLSGHNHCYDRTYPVITRGGIPVRDSQRGTVYLTAPARWSRCSSCVFPWTVRTDLPQVDRVSEYPYVYLEIDKDKLSLKYILRNKERDYYLKVKDRGYEDKLINNLGSSELSEVKKALKELGALGSLRAVPQLVNLLGNESLREEVLEALAQIGAEDVLETTNSYLNSENVSLRRSAVRLLARYGGREMINLLWEKAEDADKEVRGWAIAGLVRLAGGTQEVNQKVEDWLEGLETAKRGYNKAFNDADRDGIPDWYEITTHIYFASGDDVDGDGVNNLQEYLKGTSANSADTDGDGINDGEDVAPLNPKISQRVSFFHQSKHEKLRYFYPNPFKPEGYIPLNGKWKIYNILGQVVREIENSKAIYWNGRDSQGLKLPAGVYFCEIADKEIRKMVVLK